MTRQGFLTLTLFCPGFLPIKGAERSADLKISKSALLSSNHHNFSNAKPVYKCRK